MGPDLRTAFIGTYPPRRCGIATFTRDLSDGMRAANDGLRSMVIAVTDADGPYAYPAEVEFQIRQGSKADYTRAAELINYSDVRLVSVQHEYGIFGGDDGAYILDLMSALQMPSLVTLHTVLKSPSESQRAIVRKMATQSAGLIVMSGVAADLLSRSYDVRGAAVHVIPHGIPDMPPRDQERLKKRFGVSGRRMLLTFGLLGPNKGIETVLRALPAAVAACPDLVYFVVGATHPAVIRRNGEAYRTSLELLAEKLGVRDHVVFRDQYVTTEELCSYLQAADIFVSPYLNEEQVTSGALSYAMGAGASVVSTPYWHAKELLADGRGCLFPYADSVALSQTLVSLLNSPAELQRVRTTAYEFTRAFTWPRIGDTYVRLATEAINAVPKAARRRKPPRATSLPDLRLDHLRRLTDDTGVVQHAIYSVPERASGYCVDDNARALIVALHADNMNSTAETKRLLSTYLGFLHFAQNGEGGYHNFMRYDRTFPPASASAADSEDCVGRALWALGATVQLASDEGQRLLAREMFDRALPGTNGFGPRGTALTILGAAGFLVADPKAAAAGEALRAHSARLVGRYREEATPEWRWFESALTYDNALLPLALFRSYAVTGNGESLAVARETLEFLEKICFQDDKLVLIGNAEWHQRGGTRSIVDEQPIDAAAFVLTFRAAYLATGEHHYLRRMHQAFTWFMGANRLTAPVYDFATTGCRDGLGAAVPNLNQGAESTICFLLSLIEMLALADEELDHAARPLEIV
jgi:glycosyltransferase involved in cell wall biosynthesis